MNAYSQYELQAWFTMLSRDDIEEVVFHEFLTTKYKNKGVKVKSPTEHSYNLEDYFMREYEMKGGTEWVLYAKDSHNQSITFKRTHDFMAMVGQQYDVVIKDILDLYDHYL